MDRAVEAGELSGLPVMVDFGYFLKERPYWRLVSEKLRKDDISTHCYRGPVPVVDGNGTVYPYLFEARERGVLFDLGHGGEASFSGTPCLPLPRDSTPIPSPRTFTSRA